MKRALKHAFPVCDRGIALQVFARPKQHCHVCDVFAALTIWSDYVTTIPLEQIKRMCEI